MPELYGPPNQVNTLELPAAQVAAVAYPTPSVVSSSTWSSSPAGQANAGSLIPTLPDSTVVQRQAAAAATRLPLVRSVSPNTGSHTGGTPVTITGWGFSAATAASFGGANGTSFTVVNDTTITVTTPAGSVGAVNVVVVSPGGSGALTAGFTYT